MRNEWDISPPRADGEPVSILPEIPGEAQNGYEAAMEAEEGRESLRRRIEAELSGEPELKAVFGCLWEGETESREIANRLGMEQKMGAGAEAAGKETEGAASDGIEGGTVERGASGA